MLPDPWNCRNRSAIHHNTNQTFPNVILPVLDQTLSLLGALTNTFLIVTIIVRCKKWGFTSCSSSFYVSICVINLVECANCLLIYKSSVHWDHLKVNMYLLTASGVQDIVHFVRIGSTLPLYIVRLLFVASSSTMLNMSVVRHRNGGMIYCGILWTLGTGIGAVRTYARTKITDHQDDTMRQISFYLLLLNMVAHILALVVPMVTILYLTRILFKYRSGADTTTSGDSDTHTSSRTHDSESVDQEYGWRDVTSRSVTSRESMLYTSARRALSMLLCLSLIDMVSYSYLTLLTVTTLHVHFTQPTCWPAVLVDIKNYLGTPTNFVYSYHSLGVIYGISVSVLLFVQGAVRLTVRYMWIQCGFLVTGLVERVEQRIRGSSYSLYYI